MAALRRTLAGALVAVALLAAIPTATASYDGCQTYRASSIPVIHPAIHVGEVETCDEDGDGATDTVQFHTNYVYLSGVVGVTDEEKQRLHHEDRRTRAHTQVAASAPASPVVATDTQARDDGDDGQVDRVDGEGGLYTHWGEVSYVLLATDDDGDRVFDVAGAAVCTPAACAATDPGVIPEVPDRIDLPDTVVYVDPVGYIP